MRSRISAASSALRRAPWPGVPAIARRSSTASLRGWSFSTPAPGPAGPVRSGNRRTPSSRRRRDRPARPEGGFGGGARPARCSSSARLVPRARPRRRRAARARRASGRTQRGPGDIAAQAAFSAGRRAHTAPAPAAASRGRPRPTRHNGPAPGAPSPASARPAPGPPPGGEQELAGRDRGVELMQVLLQGGAHQQHLVGQVAASGQARAPPAPGRRARIAIGRMVQLAPGERQRELGVARLRRSSRRRRRSSARLPAPRAGPRSTSSSRAATSGSACAACRTEKAAARMPVGREDAHRGAIVRGGPRASAQRLQSDDPGSLVVVGRGGRRADAYRPAPACRPAQ